ncbi:intraflagellar transport protein 74-like [Miscanthus floridulus]|uniref:intraflagellar transport protein 74-like n=1 Tax=Miscanthus floridulus TaxID=154761 RepID=UPI003457E8E2
MGQGGEGPGPAAGGSGAAWGKEGRGRGRPPVGGEEAADPGRHGARRGGARAGRQREERRGGAGRRREERREGAGAGCRREAVRGSGGRERERERECVCARMFGGGGSGVRVMRAEKVSLQGLGHNDLMKHVMHSGIARTADQRHQLMKRMEPLAEENKILWEALSLSEKSIQRAQRERDLAESNSRDLEHQKEVLSERLTAASEQLKKTSEQLATVSEELKNMSEQLGKKNGELKNKTEQLDRKCQQFEDSKMQNSTNFAKPSSKSDKRKRKSRSEQINWPEELKDYRHKTKAQFDVLVQEAKVQKDNFNTITCRNKTSTRLHRQLNRCPVLTACSKGQIPSFRDARQRGRTSKTSTATPF